MIDDALKPDVIRWSAFYEHRMKLGSVGRKAPLDLPLTRSETHLPSGGFRGEIHENT